MRWVRGCVDGRERGGGRVTEGDRRMEGEGGRLREKEREGDQEIFVLV